jgi:ribosomal protein L15E
MKKVEKAEENKKKNEEKQMMRKRLTEYRKTVGVKLE